MAPQRFMLVSVVCNEIARTQARNRSHEYGRGAIEASGHSGEKADGEALRARLGVKITVPSTKIYNGNRRTLSL